MSEPIDATIYAHQLFQQKQGYPLWEPDPQDEPAVEIADVGYIKNGAFVRLFNASKPPGDECNKLGVPENYYPLHIGEIQKRCPLPGKVPILSESVVQLEAQASLSAGPLTPTGGGFSFECSRQQGAVLILGNDADRRDALCQLPFLKYIREQHDNWLTFANNVRQRGIAPNDLVFVTGCDKTSAWASAAFSGRSSRAGVSFQVGQRNVVEGSVALWGTWNNSSSVYTRSGPRRRVPSAFSSSGHIRYEVSTDRPIYALGSGLLDMRVSSSFSSGTQENMDSDAHMGESLDMVGLRDQCVFLRGYKMCDRRTAIVQLVVRKKKPAYDGFDHVPRRKKDEEDPDGSEPSGRRNVPVLPSGIAPSASGGGQGSRKCWILGLRVWGDF